MIRTYLSNGEDRAFHQEIDAMEWQAAGLDSFDPPAGFKPEPITETPEEEPKELVRGLEATDEFAAPDIFLEEDQESVRRGNLDSYRTDFVNTMKSCRLCCAAF